MIGSFVTSKAGHDKGRLYVVLAEMKDSVLLADGRLKTVASPKKKNSERLNRLSNILMMYTSKWLNDGSAVRVY